MLSNTSKKVRQAIKSRYRTNWIKSYNFQVHKRSLMGSQIFEGKVFFLRGITRRKSREHFQYQIQIIPNSIATISSLEVYLIPSDRVYNPSETPPFTVVPALEGLSLCVVNSRLRCPTPVFRFLIDIGVYIWTTGKNLRILKKCEIPIAALFGHKKS